MTDPTDPTDPDGGTRDSIHEYVRAREGEPVTPSEVSEAVGEPLQKSVAQLEQLTDAGLIVRKHIDGETRVFWAEPSEESRADETTTQPFRQIMPYRDVLEVIHNMQDVLEEVEHDLETAQWVALGGRGAFDSADLQRGVTALDGWQEELERQVDQLPNPYAQSDRWDHE